MWRLVSVLLQLLTGDVAGGERQDVVQVVVLTVTVATLASGEDLIAAGHRASVHLARV